VQSRKCRCALSILHSVSQRERNIEREREREKERGRERERDRGKEREREKEGERERDMLNMVALFLFLKGMTGALEPFSYLVFLKLVVQKSLFIACLSTV
jgi:hypothetical protein